LTVVLLLIHIFWNAMLCNWVTSLQHFKGTHSLHVRGQSNTILLEPRRWSRHDPSKCPMKHTQQHKCYQLLTNFLLISIRH